MQNRVGANVPTEDQVNGWVATIEKLRQEMAPFGVSLTPDERKHTLKFRPGGESIVHKIVAIVRKHDVSLPGITPDATEADLTLAQRMRTVRDAAEVLYQFADDTVLEGSSECWYAATAYYTALSRMVTSFPDIKSVVSEVAAFFASRRKSSPETPPTS